MLSILQEYNTYWYKKNYNPDLISRPDYLSRLMLLMQRREILVLKGVRRSGKSSLLKLLIRQLIENGVDPLRILFINLEDYRFGADPDTGLLDLLYDIYKKEFQTQGKVYIFLDEIQVVRKFERWLRTLYDLEVDIKFIITGSSSSLLSAELATLITGRHLSVEILPFSISEFFNYRNESLFNRLLTSDIRQLKQDELPGEILPLIREYLQKGGFPEVIKQPGSPSNILLLQQYFDDILLRDIASRYKIRRVDVLQKLALYLISNICNEVNGSRIATLLNTNRITVTELINHLQDVYLLYTVGRFSFSLNERLSNRNRKIYVVDNGLFNALKQTGSPDFSKQVENVVFQKLKFEWNENVFFWKSKFEIDFILEDGMPVNVTATDDIPRREIDSLLDYLISFNRRSGLLVSWNTFDTVHENDKKIYIVPLWYFLLRKKETIISEMEV